MSPAGLGLSQVNLVAMLNLTSLADAPGVAENCKLQHAVLTRVECPCAFESKAEGVKMDNLVQVRAKTLFATGGAGGT